MRNAAVACSGLLAAALATSVDAAAAGLTLGLFATPVWFSCVVIGGVTAVLCVAGYWFASRIGRRLGRWAELAGGMVLIRAGYTDPGRAYGVGLTARGLLFADGQKVGVAFGGGT